MALGVLLASAGAAWGQQTAALAPSTLAATAPSNGDAVALDVGQSLQALQSAMAGLDPAQLHMAKREKQALADGKDSVGRNLTDAMPALLGAFSQSPGNLGAAFRLYRDSQAVLAVAQRSADVIPARDDEAGGAALRASARRLQDSLDRLGDWIVSRGNADYTAAQVQIQTPPPAPATAPAPPATLVIQNANTNPAKASAAKPAQKKKAKTPPPTIPH